jgi:uncharacterized protein (TIGR03382 family)
MLVALTTLALANPTGKIGVAVSGCTCHGDPSSAVDVTLAADATEVDVGTIVSLTLTVEAASAKVAGLNVAGKGGVFEAGEGTRVDREQVTHTRPADFVDGSASFTFGWSNPTDGTFRLYGAALGGNGDGEEVNDGWNFLDDVTIVVGTGIAPDTGSDTGDIGDTGADPGPGCGCATDPGTAAAVLPLLIAGLAQRRRR